jgi:hypothetical protein
MISCLTDKPEFWCLTICTEVAPFNTIETSHFRQLIRILIMFSFNLGHNFFSRFHTPSCLCLFEDPLGLFPCVFCILGLFSKFCCCICPRFGRPNGGGGVPGEACASKGVVVGGRIHTVVGTAEEETQGVPGS